MIEANWEHPLTLKNEPELADLLDEISAITDPGALTPGAPYAWHLVMQTSGDNVAFARLCGLSTESRPYECVWIPWLGNFTLEEAAVQLHSKRETLLNTYREAGIPGLIIEPRGTFCRPVTH